MRKNGTQEIIVLNSVDKMSGLPATSNAPLTLLPLPPSRTTTLTPLSCSPLSRSSSQRNLETDSGKSSCSPALFDCSFDSGISVLENNDMQFQIRIQQCQRILAALQRDEDTYRKLRERLAKISQNNSESRRENDAGEEQICNVCCVEFDLEGEKCFISCCTCKKRVCRDDKCAHWLPQTAKWECRFCHSSKDSLAQTSSWVAEQMSFNKSKFIYPLRARSEIYIPISDCNDGSLQFESVSQVGIGTTLPPIISAEQKLKIREYVEEVVSQMLGGSLNSTTVGQMSKSENYLQLFHKYHPKLSRIFTIWDNALCYKALQGDLPAIINSHNGISQPNSPANSTQDFANVSELRLRQMIESIVAETIRLTSLSSLATPTSELAFDTHTHTTASPLPTGETRRHRTEHYFEPQLYQDLLATAVLNKIVDKQNKPRNYSDSTLELTNDQIIVANGHLEHHSTSSNSSVEPRSEYSYTRAQRLHKLRAGESISPCGSAKNHHTEDVTELLTAGRESALSDYLAAHMVPLPDLSAPPTDSEEDDYKSGTSSVVGVSEGCWEDNWLFKKKRSPTAVTTNSIGMLVPAPKEDIRAQIGDKTTDEVSDLSEFGSDTDDSASLGLLNANLDPPNGRLLNKHIIGGQNTKMILDELIDNASMISLTSPMENEPKYTETRNVHAVALGVKTEAVNESVSREKHLQEAQEEEVLLTLPAGSGDQDVVPTLPLSEQFSSNFDLNHFVTSTSIANNYNESANMENDDEEVFFSTTKVVHTNQTNTSSGTVNSKLTNGGSKIASPIVECDHNNEMVLRRFVPGSIAEREYKKWHNAVEMPNNPYAPEALKRRISGSQERFIDLPNINTEQKPITLVSNETSEEAESRESDYKSRDYYINETTIPIVNNSAKNANTSDTLTNDGDESDSDNIIINEPTPKLEQDTFLALPAHVVEDSTSIESSIYNSLNISTSDESDTVAIYDFKKQETKIVPSTATKTLRPSDLRILCTLTTPPARGTTPDELKFLQPKRKVIEPSEILSFDVNDDEMLDLVRPAEKPPAIEQEIVQALPSVRALAQAFLAASNNYNNNFTKNERQSNEKSFLHAVSNNANNNYLEPMPTPTEQEETTIGSELSSLQTDSITTQQTIASTYKSPTPILTLTAAAESGKISPILSAGFLRSNIDFFENLKFK